MIGQQLDGDGGDEGLEEGVCGGDGDCAHEVCAVCGEALRVRDEDDLTAAGHDFFHVADGFFEARA